MAEAFLLALSPKGDFYARRTPIIANTESADFEEIYLTELRSSGGFHLPKTTSGVDAWLT